jgi:beta-fructofuranosidase
MYFSTGWSVSEVGDIDVVAHEGRLHMFQLCLPSHDMVAHRVSDDGMHWTDAPNALHVGDPGACDDDQIWTMHVFPWEGRFYMLYTALSKAEDGRVQRTALAVSDDLMAWEKVAHNPVAAPDSRWYEADTSDSGRADWRDPFPWVEDGVIHGLISAHESKGPYNRRGCVAHIVSTDGEHWDVRPPFYTPRISTDFEVPAIVKLGERYYLIGHIVAPQIDVYRVADSLEGPWLRPANDMLLPPSNHAFSPVVWKGRTLLYNWIAAEFDWHPLDGGRHRGIAPPKEAVAGPDGELILKSYEPGWEAVSDGASEAVPARAFIEAGQTCGGTWTADADGLEGHSSPGMGFVRLGEEVSDFILECDVTLTGAVEFGIAFRSDETADQCTRVSMVPGRQSIELHRLVQRVNYNAIGRGHSTLQHCHCPLAPGSRASVRLVAWGPYVEASVNGRVWISSFTMTRRTGNLGLFVEDGSATFDRIHLTRLTPPPDFPV